MPHVRASDFEIYKIPVPLLEEQDRIVSILDKFDILQMIDLRNIINYYRFKEYYQLLPI